MAVLRHAWRRRQNQSARARQSHQKLRGCGVTSVLVDWTVGLKVGGVRRGYLNCEESLQSINWRFFGKLPKIWLKLSEKLFIFLWAFLIFFYYFLSLLSFFHCSFVFRFWLPFPECVRTFCHLNVKRLQGWDISRFLPFIGNLYLSHVPTRIRPYCGKGKKLADCKKVSTNLPLMKERGERTCRSIRAEFYSGLLRLDAIDLVFVLHWILSFSFIVFIL